MIIKNPKFEISAMSEKQYPQNNLPQIVLVGKSNVGKSSFINSMINRKNLARTSNTPGKTRVLNFYNIDDSFYFVDLPGYGYSKMSKEEDKKVTNAINTYLSKSKNISLVILLLDIRHAPTYLDKIMYDYILKSNIPFLLIANKSDKVAKTKIENYINEMKKELMSKGTVLNVQKRILEPQNSIFEHLEPFPLTIFPFSAENKIYVQDTWEQIERIAFSLGNTTT